MRTAEKICTRPEARTRIEAWQAQGDQIVFTNGCFDIMHLGHVDYLEKARAKGQRLIVALNDDASVRRLKGEKRPIVPAYPRMRMLASLAFVDLVVLFEEDTPEKVIEELKPNILVKGSDYAISNIVGASFVIAQGGKVETIDLVDGFSTTNLIEKIREAYI